jgi:putative thiamine transport system permease protein
MASQGSWLRGCVLAATLLFLFLPIAAGLAQTAFAAFGKAPQLGLDQPWAAPWRALLETPGLARAVGATLITGLGATLLSLVLAVALSGVFHHRLTGLRGARWLAPYLAMPHAALAIGLAFVLAPSGWIARVLAPVFDWAAPPGIVIVGDPGGIGLILGLTIKEVPFLVLMILAALSQIPLRQTLAVGRALGYGRGLVWIKIVLPQLWPLIRLPVMVVLAYSLSVVDMALILGPSNPPTLAVLLTRSFASPDLAQIAPASAGALMQLALVLAAFGLLRLTETALRPLGLWWLRAGGRGSPAEPILRFGAGLAVAIGLLGAVALAALAVWSLTFRWAWPDPLPGAWSLTPWSRAAAVWNAPLATTLWLALLSVAASMMLAIAWLEAEDRGNQARARWAEALIYLPLLVPQIAFLPGLNGLFLQLGLSGHLIAVAWAHALFVFPYLMIALSGPWRGIDLRLPRAAAALGAGPSRRLFSIKLPILLAPIAAAMAVGVAVSVAQYLPTLFVGAGRVATITTEAVTLSSGADRRVTAVYATVQATLPLLAYALAFALPALVFRNRRALQGAMAA